MKCFEEENIVEISIFLNTVQYMIYVPELTSASIVMDIQYKDAILLVYGFSL